MIWVKEYVNGNLKREFHLKEENYVEDIKEISDKKYQNFYSIEKDGKQIGICARKKYVECINGVYQFKKEEIIEIKKYGKYSRIKEVLKNDCYRLGIDDQIYHGTEIFATFHICIPEEEKEGFLRHAYECFKK